MSYSCNDNQNYFVSETGRTTSRVLNPPGGAASFSLGFDAPPTSSSTSPAVVKTQEQVAQQQPGQSPATEKIVLQNLLARQNLIISHQSSTSLSNYSSGGFAVGNDGIQRR
jgi:hypothetical protein